MNINNTKDFLKELNRLCISHGGCTSCPIDRACVVQQKSCKNFIIENTDELFEIVKTFTENKDDFRE